MIRKAIFIIGLMLIAPLCEAQNKSLLYQPGRGLIWRYQGGGEPPGPDVGTPIAWYKMTGIDTNETQLLDSAGSYNASNMPSVAAGPTISNLTTVCYFFDKSDDLFDIGDTIKRTTTIAVSCWFYTASTTDYGGLASKYDNADSGNRSWTLFFIPASEKWILFRVIESDGTVISSDIPAYPTYNTGVWMHVVGVADGSTVSCWTNGVLSASHAYDGTIKDVGCPIYLGSNKGGYPFGGLLDDVRIFTNLTANQITNIYTAGRQ